MMERDGSTNPAGARADSVRGEHHNKALTGHEEKRQAVSDEKPEISADDSNLVRASFQRCARSDDFFDEFYDNLCSQNPKIGRKFANTNMSQQNALVREGIKQLLAFSNGRETAHARIVELGKSHSRTQLDVHPDWYPLWVDSLLSALMEFDSEWNDSYEPAWRAALAPGIKLMITHY
jgi:hemoglobin-like flavoprotein